MKAFTNYKDVLNEIYQEVYALEDRGEVATYIPELAKINLL